MHIIITGATGFIGRAVVRAALERRHSVTAFVRDAEKARAILPAGNEQLTLCADPAKLQRGGDDRLIHLAWAEVGKYADPQNLLGNLEPQFVFLQKLAAAGLTHITVAGSCIEYGLQDGALSEDMPSMPVTYYGLAKQTLYRMLALTGGMKLNWLRYFYVYGPGQRPQALLPQLIAAIERGDKTFNMSPGDQSRDFIHVDTLARNTVLAAEQPQALGIVNIGSGQPVRVIDLVREVLQQKNYDMELNAGFYPYTAYEPFSFWADIAKLKSIPGMIVEPGFKERFIQ